MRTRKTLDDAIRADLGLPLDSSKAENRVHQSEGLAKHFIARPRGL